MSDAAFLSALETCVLPPAEFDHEAHVRAAYLYLREHDFADALACMTKSIRRYAAHLGRPEKYHETITVACLALIARHMAERGDAGGWPQFRKCNPELLAPDLLARYYDAALLRSGLARRTFLLPEPARPLIDPAGRGGSRLASA